MSIWQMAHDQQLLRQVWRGIRAESCPTEFNFHIHTVHSDGKLQPVQVIDQAIAIGLQGLAITDHHSIEGYHLAQQRLDTLHGSSSSQAAPSLPILWTGIEINAGLLGTEVHILAYAFDPEHRAMRPYVHGHTADGHHYPAHRVIDAIHQANGLAVLAHPARYRVPYQDLIPAAAQLGIDAVESYYAYNNPTPWQPSPQQTEGIHNLGQSLGLMHTCGTDTHGLNLLQRL